MKQLKVLIAVVLTLSLTACNINLGIKGNGNVVTEDRPVTENFNDIQASAGIEVYLTQGSENRISVEADENLLPYIVTDIKNEVLKISISENIRNSKSMKVHVTFIDVKSIKASSGSEISSNSVIKSKQLSVISSSGAEIDLEIFSQDVTAEASSGADIKIIGKASTLTAKASSGSEVNAKELLTINCRAQASSGADISINTRDNLDTNVSSGASINYYGNPNSVNSNKSSSGSVNRK